MFISKIILFDPTLQGLGHVQALGALPTAASPAAIAAASIAATTPTVTVADSQQLTANVPSGQTAPQQPASVSTLQGQTLTAVGGHPSLASAAGLTAAAHSPQHINMLTLQQLLAASGPAAQLGSMTNGSGKVHSFSMHVNKQ